MLLMRKCRWLRGPGLYATLLVLVLTAGCSRRLGLGADGTSQTDPHDLPFHGDADAAAAGEAASRPRVPDQRGTSSELPFDSSASPILPAGTLLTVRLESPLASSRRDSGKTFVAAIDEPVMVDGRALIPQEAQVKGFIESARVSATNRRTGYLRLTLDSIRIGDKELPLPTSSLFARGIIDDAGDDSGTTASRLPQMAAQREVIRLRKGRLLTFRLTAALDLSKQAPVDAKAQSTK